MSLGGRKTWKNPWRVISNCGDAEIDRCPDAPIFQAWEPDIRNVPRSGVHECMLHLKPKNAVRGNVEADRRSYEEWNFRLFMKALFNKPELFMNNDTIEQTPRSSQDRKEYIAEAPLVSPEGRTI